MSFLLGFRKAPTGPIVSSITPDIDDTSGGRDLTAVGGANTLGGAAVAIGTYGGTAAYAVRRLAEVFAFDRPISLRDVRTLRRYRDSYYGPVP